MRVRSHASSEPRTVELALSAGSPLLGGHGKPQQHVEAGLVRLAGGEGKLLIPRGQVLDSAGAGRDRLRQIVRDFRRADLLADSLPLSSAECRGGASASRGAFLGPMGTSWEHSNVM